jgi:hypothetical protein
MKIYWSQKNIPALKGLSPQEREAAKRRVLGKVWRHWQVWLPFAIQFAAFAVFIAVAPSFPYRLPVVILAVVFTSMLAGLPFNHYLDHYLGKQDASPEDSR